jgi:hypothetical protein
MAGPFSGRKTETRRDFFARLGLLTAAAAAAQSELLRHSVFPDAQANQWADSVPDTLNGLAAFIVPGSDPYSVQQGISDAEPGAVAACTGMILATTLDVTEVAPPPFTRFSELVAFLLNQMAQLVNPGGSGPFNSHFANLPFAQKAVVFATMESGQAGEELVRLGGILPTLTAFIAYSEAGLVQPEHCTINGVPVGWLISGYQGVADGRDDFRGYFQGRQSTL